jgi:uncharacterized lipoprotein
MKAMIALAAAVAVLATAGCCWPIREHRYRSDDRWSDGSRSGHGDRHGDRDGDRR